MDENIAQAARRYCRRHRLMGYEVISDPFCDPSHAKETMAAPIEASIRIVPNKRRWLGWMSR